MHQKYSVRIALFAIAICVFATNGFAGSAAVDSGYTGAPGEQNCSLCHLSGNAFGNIKVVLTNSAFYTPGTKQRLMVTVADPSKIEWGFQLTARQTNSTNTQAGSFTPIDPNTQVVCNETSLTASKQQFGTSPCPSSKPLQWIEHTSLGNFTGQQGMASWQFDWLPPSTNVGSITLYVAGVASNGGGNDNVYTQKYVLTVPLPNQPNITGVANGASYQGTISPGSWVTITGANLANSTRGWGSGDIINGSLPTQLDGVGVTIDGKPAFVEYVSPTQLNVLAPLTISSGAGLQVQVMNNGLASNAGTISAQSAVPALFEWNNKYSVATRPDFSLVGPPNLFQGATTIPSRPGDVIILWATGLGTTTPAVANGQLTPTGATFSVNRPPTVMIGGVSAQVIGAALATGFAGLYQIAVQVPNGLADGDQPVTLTSNSVTSPAGVFLTIRATPVN